MTHQHIETIDTPVSGVLSQTFPAGIPRGELVVGDLLTGAGLSPHGGEIAEVAEVSARGLWLVSMALPLASRRGPAVRTKGRYFTWPGLAQLTNLTRLRLDASLQRADYDPGAYNPASAWYVGPQGQLLVTQGGFWLCLRPNGERSRVALPIGAVLRRLAPVLGA